MTNPSMKCLVTGALSAAAVALAAAAPASAFNPQPEPPGVTAFGVQETQTATMHVSYGYRDPGSEVSGIQPEPFRVAIGFYDASGTLIARSVESVGLGQVVSLHVTGRQAGAVGASRRTIYGVVECLDSVQRRVECARTLSANLEVFNSLTGATATITPCVMPSIVPVIVRNSR